jgi:hypothetical protein
MNYYRSAIRKLHTALTLSRADWEIFIKAWFWLAYIDVLLRSRPYMRVLQLVESQPPKKQVTDSAQAWNIILHNQRFVRLAAQYHFHWMGCLRQALTLKKFLAAQGIPTELRFGVRKGTDQFLAHAWLEFERQSIDFVQYGKEPFIPLAALQDRQ